MRPEELLRKFGLWLRPGIEGKPLKHRPGRRFSYYIRFITWFLPRYPDAVEQPETEGQESLVEIITLPDGTRALHEEGIVTSEGTLPVTFGGSYLPRGTRPPTPEEHNQYGPWGA